MLDMSELASALPRTFEVIDRGMREGLHVGAQIYVSRGAQTVIDAGIGESRPGVAMTPDSMMIWMSSSKPVTAVAIAQLWQAGLLQLDDPIARHLPEFAAHGKDRITIRHALTHTGGFRGIASRYDSVPWEQAIAALCDVRPEPNWPPGGKAGYHIASSWYILGEIVQRLSGLPFSQYLREKIFQPLGMADSWLGMPANQYAAYGDRIGVMHQSGTGSLDSHRTLDTLATTTAPHPGFNGRGPMHDLGKLYEALMTAVRGLPTSVGSIQLSRQTVEAMTTRHRVGLLDHTFRLTVDWALGFICNTPNADMQKFAYGFGPHASMRAFGHGGNQSSLGMADPEHGLVVAVVFNGMPGEPAHATRMRETMTAIYEDLSLNS